MKLLRPISLLIAFLCTTVFNLRAEDWPWWRGPRQDGSSTDTNVPLHWSLETNLLWKVELPAQGHASPIVHGKHIFTVGADTESKHRVLMAFDRNTGKMHWKSSVLNSPLEGKHSLNSWASSTPATDGEKIYVTCLDKKEMVVAAYDFQGKQQWLVRPGTFSSMHGFCSSPLIYKDLLLINGDHDGDSYLVAVSRKDGSTVWKTSRANKTRSYCVPIVRELSGRTQMILSGDKSVASYDPATGKQHWIMDGPTEQFVASIVYNSQADLIFVSGGYPEFHILGMKHDGKGKIGDEKIVWRSRRGASYVPSPVSQGAYFFIVSDAGIGSCYDAKTGKNMWQERMAAEHHASLVTTPGKIYFLSDTGVTTVVEAGPEFKVLAKNDLGEKCFASPAISNGQIFIRGDKHLFAIGKK